VLLAFLALLGWSGAGAFAEGTPEQLLSPVDAAGELCGVAYPDYRYVYYAIKVTVEPPSLEQGSQGGLAFVGEKAKEREPFSEEPARPADHYAWLGDTPAEVMPVCVKECPADKATPVDCHGAENPGTGEAIDAADCANVWDGADAPTAPGTYIVGYGTLSLLSRLCLPNPDELPTDSAYLPDVNNVIGDFGLDDLQEILEDIRAARMAYLYASLTCLVVAFIYLMLTRFFTKVLVWASIIGVGVGLLATALLLQMYHTDHYGSGCGPNGAADCTGLDGWGTWLQAAVYVLYGACVLYALTIACGFRTIQVGVAVLKTAATIVLRNSRVLAVPLVACVFICGYVVLWFYAFAYLLSCANITQPTDGTQLKEIDFHGKEGLKWQIAVFVFGFFWILELLAAIF